MYSHPVATFSQRRELRLHASETSSDIIDLRRTHRSASRVAEVFPGELFPHSLTRLRRLLALLPLTEPVTTSSLSETV